MSVRILQITDCHLLSDPEGELRGIRTHARLTAVLETIRVDWGDCDRLVITGDLAHDEQLESYRALHALTHDWHARLRVIPGNHDQRDFMAEVFGARVQQIENRNQFVDELEHWKLIGLDTHLPGEVKGRVGPAQLTWLDGQLAADLARHVAIFMHHPPARVHSTWLDQVGLEDVDSLVEIVARYPRVKVVCAGHIHQELAIAARSCLVLTSPSTGVQFRPGTEALEVDQVAPGFRVLDLDADGTLRSRVIRVPIETGP